MLVYGSEPKSSFGLMGQGENAATLALAWCFDRSEGLRRAFVAALGKPAWPTDPWAVACQAHADDKGFTDIEVQAGSFHLLVEAKAGMTLPSEAQLRRYITRLGSRRGQEHLVVTISAASQSWAKSHGVQSVEGVPVKHLAWSDVVRLARDAERKTRSPIEKLWLNELISHLEGYGMAQNRFDARAFVVVLSNDPLSDRDPLTWIDVVVEQGRYFHPFGKGWPSIPPAYLGFRYRSAFRSAHFVEDVQIVDRLTKIDKRWPSGEGPHVVYTLGPPMTPKEPLALGKIYYNAHHYVALDLLLSGRCATYADAIALTKEREAS
jgi:hypothetical protein